MAENDLALEVLQRFRGSDACEGGRVWVGDVAASEGEIRNAYCSGISDLDACPHPPLLRVSVRVDRPLCKK